MFAFISLLLALFVIQPLRADERPELVVTRIFIGAGSEINDDFLENGGRDLAASEGEHLVILLKALPQYRVHNSFFSNPSEELGTLDESGNRVYVRAIVTRADLDRRRYFGDLQLWLFSIGLSLEFFDIQSGQVYYNRSITSRVPVETAEEIDPEYRRARFAEAFRSGLEHLVAQCGKSYLPTVLRATIVQNQSAEEIFLDAGATGGIRQGQVLKARSDDQSWLLKAADVQQKFSRLRILASTSSALPAPGVQVELQGANQLNVSQSGSSIAVAGISTVDPAALASSFDVDNGTMGQWLHDALAETSDLNLLPPLLIGTHDEGNELSAAFFSAQAAFSTYGDVRQDDLIGNRPIPDRLVRALVTHAVNQQSQRLGFVSNQLILGVSLEVYDRRTREILATAAVEERHTEKQSKGYRQADLVAAWRNLSQRSLRRAAKLIVSQLPNAEKELKIDAVDHGILLAADPGDLGMNQLLTLFRPEREIRNLKGEILGQWLRPYAMARTKTTSAGQIQLDIQLEDGTTTAKAGDLLSYRPGNQRPLAQLVSLEIGGPKVMAEYNPNPDMVLAWLHRELAGSGLFRMLPPESQRAAFAEADVRLAGGEFQLTDTGELLAPAFPEPQIQIHARLGLARVLVDAGNYRNKLTFSTGLELRFEDASGQPLLWLRDTGKADRIKLVYSEPAEQELDQRQVVQGLRKEEFPNKLDQTLQQCSIELIKKLQNKAGPLP